MSLSLSLSLSLSDFSLSYTLLSCYRLLRLLSSGRVPADVTRKWRPSLSRLRFRHEASSRHRCREGLRLSSFPSPLGKEDHHYRPLTATLFLARTQLVPSPLGRKATTTAFLEDEVLGYSHTLAQLLPSRRNPYSLARIYSYPRSYTHPPGWSSPLLVDSSAPVTLPHALYPARSLSA